MTMKSGTGEDPFADDPEPTVNEERDDGTDTENENSTDDSLIEEESMNNEDQGDTETGDELEREDIPWVLRRSRVKDDRPEMLPVYVREETADAEPEFIRAVEDAVGKDVYKFDVREAAILVAMNHPEEVAAQLNDWGYKFID